jgi:hypothetical protein
MLNNSSRMIASVFHGEAGALRPGMRRRNEFKVDLLRARR